jgi:hypothetical protein
MVDDFFVLGLPITHESATPEFIDFLKSSAPTVLVDSSRFHFGNNDYQTAKVGYDMLLSAGYKFVYSMDEIPSSGKCVLSLDLWRRSGGKLKPSQLVAEIMHYAKLIQQKYKCNVGYITTGSPFLYDAVCEKMQEKHPDTYFVDTKSSAQLAYESVGASAPINVVDNMRIKLKPGHVNMLGCLGEIYSLWTDYDVLMSALTDDMIIYDVKLGPSGRTTKLTKSQLIDIIKTDKYYLNTSTIAVIV